MLVDAVILAGNTNLGSLKEHCEVDNKALIPIGNKLMIDYVVNALRQSSFIKKIIIAGPVKDLTKYNKCNDIIVTSCGNTIMETIKNGLEKVDNSNYVLLTTSDIPLLSKEAIDSFFQKCNDKKFDLYYPIVSKKVNEDVYPNVKRTYVNFKEGIFTGGNIFLFKPKIINGCADKGEELFALRKNPICLVQKIGYLFILKYLLKILTLKEVEEHFSKLLGLKGKAIILKYPEVGIDVDKMSDLELVRNVLS